MTDSALPPGSCRQVSSRPIPPSPAFLFLVLLLAGSLLLGSTLPGYAADDPLVPLSKVDYPIRSVERPITLTRGWVELALGLSVLGSDFFYDNREEKIMGTYDYRETTLSLSGRYGLTRSLTLGFSVPFVWKHFENQNDVDLKEQSMGDALLWLTYQFYGKKDPTTSLAFRIWSRVPSENESPGTVNNSGLQTLITSWGTYSLAVALLGKQQLSSFALEAEAGYVWRISGTVMFVQGMHAENGHMNWGNKVYARAGASYQIPDCLVPYLSPVLFPYVAFPLHAIAGKEAKGINLGAFARYTWWGASEMGIRDNLQEIPLTEGWILQVVPHLRLEISRHWDLDLRATVPLAGKNTNYAFPLDAAGISGTAVITLRF